MWALSDGDSGRGKLSGQIWDGAYGKYFSNAYDAFFDCFDNDAVIEYLRDNAAFKCEDPEDITPDSIRKNIEDNLILEYFKAHKEYRRMVKYSSLEQISEHISSHGVNAEVRGIYRKWIVLRSMILGQKVHDSIRAEDFYKF
jgi:hypothetical protein